MVGLSDCDDPLENPKCSTSVESHPSAQCALGWGTLGLWSSLGLHRTFASLDCIATLDDNLEISMENVVEKWEGGWH